MALWVSLAAGGTELPSGATAPGSEAVPPLLLGVAIFSALAVTAAATAVRGAPVVTALCGGIGLVPVGLYTFLLPWPYPLVGVLNVALLGAGVLLLRMDGGEAGEATAAPPSPR